MSIWFQTFTRILFLPKCCRRELKRSLWNGFLKGSFSSDVIIFLFMSAIFITHFMWFGNVDISTKYDVNVDVTVVTLNFPIIMNNNFDN